MNENDLLNNISKLKTPELGKKRLRKNLEIKGNVINFCKKMIIDNKTGITKNGKNWYVINNNIILTINATSYTIITGHIL